MTDRIPRPPVKLKGSLPDGTLNGLGAVAAELLGSDPAPVYALVCLVLTNIDIDVEHDRNRTAILRIAAVEPLPDGKLDATAGPVGGAELLAEFRSERVGDNPIDFGVDYSHLEDLRRELAIWQAEQELDDRAMADEWRDYFGDAGGSWRDAAAAQLREFLGARRDEAPGEAADIVVDDADDEGPVGP